jgi:hypothetical protein
VILGYLKSTHLTRGHHHATTDSVKRVRGDTGTSGDGPSEEERSKEVALEVTSENDGLERVVHSEVETTVDNDTGDRGTETTVETHDTVRGEGLLVDVQQSVELALAITTLLGGLGVVGETGTGVVEGVDEEERSGTGHLEEEVSDGSVVMKMREQDLHHQRPSCQPSTTRNHHAPSCSRTWP